MEQLKIRELPVGKEIWCQIRRKWLKYGPEEEVRQKVLSLLELERDFPLSRMAVEKEIKVGHRRKRFDILVYNALHKPIMLIECKAESVALQQEVMNQVAAYNIPLQVPYLITTNWKSWFCVQVDLKAKQASFISDIPNYNELTSN